MGCMVTRLGITRHAYAALPQPGWVTSHAITASAPHPRGGAGQSLYPVNRPVSSFAADGAPYYVTGWRPGAAVQVAGGTSRFALPPRAAQVDLTDRSSWDRPVFFPGSN